MKNYTKSVCSLLLSIIFLGNTLCLQAQVTIGSDKAPVNGALLQLKENVTDADPLTNATKGLLLPRVKLSNLTPTNDKELAESIGNTTDSYGINTHIGLVVYNVNPPKRDKLCRLEGLPLGLYVWNGQQWQPLNESKGEKRTRKVEEDVREVTDDGTQITISYNGEVTSYRYSKFGDAGTWMTENLATTYLPNGNKIPKYSAPSSDPSLPEPQYVIPNNGSVTKGKEGLQYNWSAAMGQNGCLVAVDQCQVKGDTPGEYEVETVGEKIQGICPKGWHLPSDREWNEMEKVMTTDGYENYAVDGFYLNENEKWNPDWETTDGDRGYAAIVLMTNNNGAGTGFSKAAADGGMDILLPGISPNGTTENYGYTSQHWTSSAKDETRAWTRQFDNYTDGVYRSSTTRNSLISIRCKKDE